MDTLRLYVVTWNVATKFPDSIFNVDELLGLDDSRDSLPELYAVGFQEVKSQVHNLVLDALFDDPWTRACRDGLVKRDYVKIKTMRLQGLVLSLFVKRSKLLLVRDMAWDVVRTGLAGLWGNKGGVGIRVSLSGVNFCFVNTHLTPHDHNLDARIKDYNSIVQQMRFTKHPLTEMIFYHDYVIWLGDHNFRINEGISREEILTRIVDNSLEWLLEREQLKVTMKAGEAFHELTEPAVKFPPTYKFIFDTAEYDPKRRPAWTDRILYRVTEDAYENLKLSVKVDNYTSLPRYKQSDHKPVIASFQLKIMADYIDRVVEFEPISSWSLSEPNNIVIKFSQDVMVNEFDWIALYKADFGSIDEYLTFRYVSANEPINHSARSDRKLTVPFSDLNVRAPGQYCLLYITKDFDSVLGSSNVFRVTPCDGKFRGVYLGGVRANFRTDVFNFPVYKGTAQQPKLPQRTASHDHSSYPSLVSPNTGEENIWLATYYNPTRRPSDSSSLDSD